MLKRRQQRHRERRGDADHDADPGEPELQPTQPRAIVGQQHAHPLLVVDEPLVGACTSLEVFLEALSSAKVLTSMITPAVLISACGTLIFSTSARTRFGSGSR